MVNARELLIALAVKYNGEWEKIYNDIKEKVMVSEEEVKENCSKVCKYQIITILDKEYPDKLKNSYKSPFVLFCEGDTDLLNENIVAFDKENNKYIKEVNKAILLRFKTTNEILIEKHNRELLVKTKLFDKNEHELTKLMCSLCDTIVIVGNNEKDISYIVFSALSEGKEILIKPQMNNENHISNTYILEGATPLLRVSQLNEL